MIKMDTMYPLIQEAFNNDLDFSFPVSGTSMRPLLKTKDIVKIRKIEKVKKGDIILYRRDNGQFVLHRILKVYEGKCNIVGDHQTNVEKDVLNSCFIGVVVSYKKKGKDKEYHLKGLKYNIYKIMVRFKLFRWIFSHF